MKSKSYIMASALTALALVSNVVVFTDASLDFTGIVVGGIYGTISFMAMLRFTKPNPKMYI